MTMFLTSELTTAPNAAPSTTATDRSIRLPLNAKVLNSDQRVERLFVMARQFTHRDRSVARGDPRAELAGCAPLRHARGVAQGATATGAAAGSVVGRRPPRRRRRWRGGAALKTFVRARCLTLVCFRPAAAEFSNGG